MRKTAEPEYNGPDYSATDFRRPADIGFPPEKFPEWRQGQRETIEHILESGRSGKYGYLLDSPVGSGKSISAVAVQRLESRRAVYLTNTKGLQEQLLRDHPKDARVLMGRSNYQCIRDDADEDTTAEDCPPKKCRNKDICPYECAKREAFVAPLAILNYDYYMLECEFIGTFAGRLLICDEADEIEDKLMNQVKVEMTRARLAPYLTWPRDDDSIESWVEWARGFEEEIRHEVADLEERCEEEGEHCPRELVRRMKKAQALLRSVTQIVEEVNEDNWTLTVEDQRFGRKWVLKPIWVDRYGFRYLWRYSPQVICMSGTIMDPAYFARTVGLPNADKQDYDYHRLPSYFPVARRPIFYHPVARLTYELMAREKPKMLTALARILRDHPDWKTLVHSTSYPLAKDIMESLGPMFPDRLMTHDRDPVDKEEALIDFKAAEAPVVMVSPSMDRGVDLPYDQCRLNIVVKTPFPNYGDIQTQKRLRSKGGRQWYDMSTVSTVIQMTGRGMRAPDDWCKTIILDSAFKRVYDKMVLDGIMYNWFTEAVRYDHYNNWQPPED